ncbi:hypothetical protein A3C91_00220 [Candidatus Azambacteria bacterium RIFCSPHIGHO2_02_FULL_52_12]|uniref:Response regulatory domain-containing protein n=1 Tax=Candidatus Azambacteria bacterium RIFCSPLOWO2_01_FULL_46_25 TaxID=1797298 RepID=A0A1F5BUL2_9BACT|nr:MAG: hypothetical protein A3C91_00220 [Candidatus Azambacteria bacterium RIFCSPHIGHO2_02_FULL_52_12]OGD34307.1 MAG: hypothetical protein A2988_02140 [Candidatus Azambacteria bacterium RIFCSPLOWO2_01_FULL_46_25]OGD37766.1 MAG: hypothetical protein A2850_03445 [Candidatus Azambacteria bacterium RIFCSPHIGHO2_01_FULL_51_74]
MEQKTILVVEDEAPLQEAISFQLEKSDVRVLAASSAEEALKILEGGERPALIWLDLLMPGMGGFAFLEKLRASEKFRDVPVAIVSVSASQEKIRRAFELNVVDYLVKSQYKISDLADRVVALLK